MNRLVVSAGAVAVGVAAVLAMGSHLNAQQGVGAASQGADEVGTARIELVKLREKAAVGKADSEARLAYLRQEMEQLTKETDAAIAADGSIAANIDAERLLEERAKALRAANVGSADDQTNTEVTLAGVRERIVERQELLRTRYDGGAMGVISEELIRARTDIRGKQAELDAIAGRLAALGGK